MTSFTDATIPSNPNQPEEADCSQKDESSNMRLLGDLKANEYFTSRRLGRKRTQTKLYSPLVTDKRLRSQSEASSKQDAVQSEIEGKKKISHFSLPKREVIFDVFERFDTLCKKSLQVDNKKQDKVRLLLCKGLHTCGWMSLDFRRLAKQFACRFQHSLLWFRVQTEYTKGMKAMRNIALEHFFYYCWAFRNLPTIISLNALSFRYMVISRQYPSNTFVNLYSRRCLLLQVTSFGRTIYDSSTR